MKIYKEYGLKYICMHKINGQITKIIFSSVNNDFFVLNVKLSANQIEEKKNLDINEDNNNITVIMDNSDFESKLLYEFYLEKKHHKKHGITYLVKELLPIVGTDVENAVKYLSSSLFNGISKKTAEKIMDKFGLNFFINPLSFQDELEKLIGAKKTATIFLVFDSQKEMQEVIKKFIDNNLSISFLNNLKKHISQNKIMEFLQNDIYEIIDLFESIDYIELDKIASVFYKDYSLENKIDFLILSSMKKNEFSGSTVLKINDIYRTCKSIFPLDKKEFEEGLIRLVKSDKVKMAKCKTSFSLTKTFNKELFISNKILSLASNQAASKKYKIEDQQLDVIQMQALKNSLDFSLNIITGSPGTGKTLLVQKIVDHLVKNDEKRFEVLAPTGKAATQISKRASVNAKTIHSFLRWNKISFEINNSNPSNVEILIIDEFSMVNVDLFFAILDACPFLKKLILVGDKNQLPPIGAGYLLNDFIESDCFNVSKLQNIYRQKENSLIIKNALMINEEQMPDFNEEECVFTELDNQQILNEILKLVQNYLKENEHLNNMQILIPMYAGNYGIDFVNNEVQKIINENKKPLLEINAKKFYLNDKVIQIENDIEKNVFNGEIGNIEGIIYKNNNIVDKIIVNFDNKSILYSTKEFNEQTRLAYAISIHKFQGSETDFIILVVGSSHSFFFSKKMLYTAFTRAKKKIVILGQKEVFKNSISRDYDSKRIGNILLFLKNKNEI